MMWLLQKLAYSRDARLVRPIPIADSHRIARGRTNRASLRARDFIGFAISF